MGRDVKIQNIFLVRYVKCKGVEQSNNFLIKREMVLEQNQASTTAFMFNKNKESDLKSHLIFMIYFQELLVRSAGLLKKKKKSKYCWKCYHFTFCHMQ